MQKGLKPMDGTSSTARFLSQRGTAKWVQPSLEYGASSAALCAMFNVDQVWLEELIGPCSDQSSPSQPSSPSVLSSSSSPGGSGSSSEGTGSLSSWSSGVSCLLHSSIKRQSREAFQTQLREERGWGHLAVCPSRGPHRRVHPQTEQGGGSNCNKLQAWPERTGLGQGRGSAGNITSVKSVKRQWLLEEKIEAKLKFSAFLNEVTSNVFDHSSLQAFGRPFSPSSSTNTTSTDQPEEKIQVVTQWHPGPPRSMAQRQGGLPEQKKPQEQLTPPDLTQKCYLETDIDAVRGDDAQQDLEIIAETRPQLEIDGKNVIPPPPQFCQGFEMTSLFPEFYCNFPRHPYRSASLPRGINMVSDESCPSLLSKPGL